MAFLNKTGLERLWIHVMSQLGNKVNKVDGKSLSTNDYTTEEKEKLASLSSVSMTGDYNDLVNKPEIPSIEGLATELYVENTVTTKVNTEISNLVNSAPETLDTLGELATALQENQSVVDALNSAIGNKVDKVDGKGLSTNDYTTEDKEKLAEINTLVGNTSVSDQIATAIFGYATESYVNTAIEAIPTPDVSGQIEAHNISEESHSDIRSAINNLNTLVGDISVEEQIRESMSVAKENITLIDKVNGFTYVVCMRNGELASYCTTESIILVQNPDKTEYLVGEYFDPTGMIIVATAQDGTTREITNYTYSTEALTNDTNFVAISYIENNIAYTVSVPITIKSIEDALIDFEYTNNGDGTYTITEWKGTYNGETSAEMIVPDYECIKI